VLPDPGRFPAWGWFQIGRQTPAYSKASYRSQPDGRWWEFWATAPSNEEAATRAP
jgi:hypothetical protein